MTEIQCDPLQGKLINSAHLFEIDTTPCAASTFIRVANGLIDFTVTNNEVIDQPQYLDGEGFAETDVTGKQVIIAFSGDRVYGEPAQEFVVSLVDVLGEGRKTNFKWTKPDGTVKQGVITVANIVDTGGASENKGTFSFEVHYNAKPATIPPATINALTIVTETVSDGDTGVSVSAVFEVEFNNAILQNTVGVQTFALKEIGTIGNVAGTYAFNIDGVTISFSPDSPLSAVTTYVLTIDGVKDVFFQSLPALVMNEFTTA